MRECKYGFSLACMLYSGGCVFGGCVGNGCFAGIREWRIVENQDKAAQEQDISWHVLSGRHDYRRYEEQPHGRENDAAVDRIN